ncbi:MAG: hypothetical protein HY735_30200 [Verrucomicrobia bacterium]|nr:hypothetical protein [Verrucomicrobiota bacterium]
MGSAGNLPAPVGNLPTGTAAGVAMASAQLWFIDAAHAPSGWLPDGTGG